MLRIGLCKIQPFLDYCFVQGVTVLLIANVGVAVLLCVIFRHQSLLQDNHSLKMRKVRIQN